MCEKVLEVCKKTIKKASKEIIDIYSTDFSVRKKTDKSPVTEADIRANKIIVKELKKNFDYLIVSEEIEGKSKFCNEKYCFIVDPIDGTKEFIKKNGEFTINIALLKEDSLIFGMIYAPILNELYYAIRGRGAYFVKNDKERKITVSNRKDKLNILISRSHQREKSVALLKNNEEKINKITRLGSSLKGCKIAAGLQDAYYRFGPTSIWDTAAMDIIVEEAGGKLRLLNGNPIDYRKKELINDSFYIINNEENLFLK